MNYNDLVLARLQAEALYVYDAKGRLLRVNEPDPEDPAPRFFLARTLEGNLWRTRYDLPAYLSSQIGRIVSDEPIAGSIKELKEPPRYIAEYTALLRQHAPITSIYAGPAYYLPVLDAPTNVVTIVPQNAALLQTNFPFTRSHLAERSPVVAAVEEEVAVAVCYSARSTTHVAEAGVYTVETCRGRGLAEQTVRGWAAGVRATGLIPLYSTWWENAASQAVATKLGAILYAVDLSLT